MHFPAEILRGNLIQPIVADAAYSILSRDARRCSGNFFIDEDVLREEGVEDFEVYALTPGAKLYGDLFLQ